MANRHPGTDSAIRPDDTAGADHGPGADLATLAQLDPGTDDRVGVDPAPRADRRARIERRGVPDQRPSIGFGVEVAIHGIG
jgi:hypothetical protein